MEPQYPHTALLVMDLQPFTLAMVGSGREALAASINKAIRKAQTVGMPVIYAVLAFKKGYPEVSPNNKTFTVLKNSGLPLDTPEAARVDDSIEMVPNAAVVIKKRISAFAGSDLELVLRSGSIQHLVLAGISTGSVVLSTLREAIDKDYMVTVLRDCCADREEEVHDFLMTRIISRHAEVVGVDEWVAGL